MIILTICKGYMRGSTNVCRKILKKWVAWEIVHRWRIIFRCILRMQALRMQNILKSVVYVFLLLSVYS